MEQTDSCQRRVGKGNWMTEGEGIIQEYICISHTVRQRGGDGRGVGGHSREMLSEQGGIGVICNSVNNKSNEKNVMSILKFFQILEKEETLSELSVRPALP